MRRSHTAASLLSILVAIPLLANEVLSSAPQGERPFVDVSVTDKGEAPVRGLSAKDFEVREGGKPAPVISAEPETDPLNVWVVYNRSQPSGLEGFVSAVLAANRRNRVTIESPSGAVNADAPDWAATLDAWARDETRTAQKTGPGGVGNLVDNIGSILRELGRSRPQRPVVFACMDDRVQDSIGWLPVPEQHSIIDPFEGEFRSAHASLWMLITPNVDGQIFDLRRTVLAEVVGASGGRSTLDQSDPPELTQMAAMLLSEYRVTFSSPAGVSSGDLQVKVARDGAIVAAPKWPARH